MTEAELGVRSSRALAADDDEGRGDRMLMQQRPPSPYEEEDVVALFGADVPALRGSVPGLIAGLVDATASATMAAEEQGATL